MSSRKVLALGAALALHVAAAHAQGTEDASVPAVPTTEVTAPAEQASEVRPAEPAPDAMAAVSPEAARPEAAEPAYAVASDPVQPLGDAMAQDTAPALGTPPAVPPAVPAPQSPVALPKAPAPLPAAAAGQPVPSVAAVPAQPRVAGPVPVIPVAPKPVAADMVEMSKVDYRKRLAPCIEGRSCDRRGLTASDQDYLRYDRGEVRLSRDDLEEVAEARMLQFDGTPTVLVRKAEPAPEAAGRVATIVNHGRRVAHAARTRVARAARMRFAPPKLEAQAPAAPAAKPQAHAEARP